MVGNVATAKEDGVFAWNQGGVKPYSSMPWVVALAAMISIVLSITS